jgi:hypothetical protein
MKETETHGCLRHMRDRRDRFTFRPVFRTIYADFSLFRQGSGLEASAAGLSEGVTAKPRMALGTAF